MASPGKCFKGLLGQSRFIMDDTSVCIGGGSRRRGAPFVADASRIAGHLNVHPEVDPVDEHLDLPLRLHITSHDPKDKNRLTIAGDQRWDDGMERTFLRFQSVGVILREGKKIASVLQCKADFPWDNLTPEPVEIALDQGAAVAIRIDHAQIDGIALDQFRVAMGDIDQSPLGVDASVLNLCIGFAS